MFGSVPGESVVHDESSALNPQSPYAAAKAAAHMLCKSYRESYGIRIACGILFNHESRRRGSQFLSRKVVDHVHALRDGRSRRAARARQPEGSARLGLRAGLRRRDGDDPPPGRRPRRAGRGRGLPRLRPRHGQAPLRLGARRPRLRARRLRARLVARRRRPARVVGPLHRLRRARGRRRSRRSSGRPTRRRSPPTRARIEAELGWEPKPGLDRFLEDMLEAEA